MEGVLIIKKSQQITIILLVTFILVFLSSSANLSKSAQRHKDRDDEYIKSLVGDYAQVSFISGSDEFRDCLTSKGYCITEVVEITNNNPYYKSVKNYYEKRRVLVKVGKTNSFQNKYYLDLSKKEESESGGFVYQVHGVDINFGESLKVQGFDADFDLKIDNKKYKTEENIWKAKELSPTRLTLKNGNVSLGAKYTEGEGDVLLNSIKDIDYYLNKDEKIKMFVVATIIFTGVIGIIYVVKHKEKK